MQKVTIFMHANNTVLKVFIHTYISIQIVFLEKKINLMKLLKTFSKTGKSDGKTIESCRVKKLRIFATKPMKTGYCYENHVQ